MFSTLYNHTMNIWRQFLSCFRGFFMQFKYFQLVKNFSQTPPTLSCKSPTFFRAHFIFSDGVPKLRRPKLVRSALHWRPTQARGGESVQEWAYLFLINTPASCSFVCPVISLWLTSFGLWQSCSLWTSYHFLHYSSRESFLILCLWYGSCFKNLPRPI